MGPKLHHRTWLKEVLVSILDQSSLPDEIVLVNDGGESLDWYRSEIFTVHYNNPCNLGVVASLNIGVAIATHELVLLGCADDRLLPNCVERCWQAWNKYQEPLAYYYLGVEYSDGRVQNTACGAAMVTKQLWHYTGGFPAQAAVGAADHIFLSQLIAGSRDGYSKAQILRVSDELTYWYRVHDNIETSKNIWPAIDAVRDRLTSEWRPRE